MQVFLTGAAGFIGSHTAQGLVARGHEVVALDSFDSTLYPGAMKRENLKMLQKSLPAKSFRFVEGDICDAKKIAEVFDDKVDVVCHLAALAGVRPSLEQPLRYVEVNIGGTTIILERMRVLGKKRLVFASSSSVYGARTAGPFREDEPCDRPNSQYAASKRMGELLCATYRELYGIGSSHMRYFTVYGPRQRPDMAIHIFVTRIAQDKPITIFGDGSSSRDYTYIDDIVAGNVAACERVQPGTFNLYNLGGTQTTTLRELVALCEKVVGKKARIEQSTDQPGDVPTTSADISNARRDLDYTPTTDIETGIRHFWEWWQSSRKVS